MYLHTNHFTSYSCHFEFMSCVGDLCRCIYVCNNECTCIYRKFKIWIIINNAYKREKFVKLGCNNLGKERLE